MPCDNNAKTSSDIEHVDWSAGTGSGHHYAHVRFGSGSSQASQSSGDICRICHCESDPQNPLLTPCYCSGSLKYVHQSCLQQWLTASDTNSCELCKFPFIMHTKIKPFNEWRSLDISGIERRRLCCSVLFHCAAALCVVWSLCVLIERAADDVQRGLIDWPFWTKLAVVTVGLTGGIVFMYIQCKTYLHLCHRWKARNRILLIQNAPEKIRPQAPSSPVAVTHNGITVTNITDGQAEFNDSSHAPNLYQYATAAASAACATAVAGLAIGRVAVSSSAANAVNNCSANNSAKQRNQHLLLSSSPAQMLQRAELDMLGAHGERPIVALESGDNHHQQQQVAVAASIECVQFQHRYERDWALDDVVSQISSFRPCPQGSGSMTPFHDFTHNVLENSETSSRDFTNDMCNSSSHDLSMCDISSDTGREQALHLSNISKVPSASSSVSHAVASGLGGFVYKPSDNKRYSNSSIFLENRDILNDAMTLGADIVNTYEYNTHLTIDYCQSNILTASQASENLRGFSETKLLSSTEHILGENHRRQVLNLKRDAAVLDIGLPISPLSPPAAHTTNSGGGDSMQLNKFRRSFDTIDVFGDNVNCVPVAQPKVAVIAISAANTNVQQIDRTRLFFKSLPNLSSSCESLIKK